jgi:hypothetical protein
LGHNQLHCDVQNAARKFCVIATDWVRAQPSENGFFTIHLKNVKMIDPTAANHDITIRYFPKKYETLTMICTGAVGASAYDLTGCCGLTYSSKFKGVSFFKGTLKHFLHIAPITAFIDAVFTISSTLHPRERSNAGRFNPCTTGPIASAPPSRCASL